MQIHISIQLKKAHSNQVWILIVSNAREIKWLASDNNGYSDGFTAFETQDGTPYPRSFNWTPFLISWLLNFEAVLSCSMRFDDVFCGVKGVALLF